MVDIPKWLGKSKADVGPTCTGHFMVWLSQACAKKTRKTILTVAMNNPLTQPYRMKTRRFHLTPLYGS